MNENRRNSLKAASTAAVGLALRKNAFGGEKSNRAKTHLVTLSFDDGFKKSSIRTAEIYEKYRLSACINVIASAHLPTYRSADKYQEGVPKGDFGLWNELQARGHEILPHGYKHANKRSLPLDQAKDLIRRCLEGFAKELKGVDPKQAIFSFPYNASTPELEAWLPTQVRAFRTGGGALNPWPHKGQARLTCSGSGPGNCERALDREVERLLSRPAGWLIYNLHGLDNEGWGPPDDEAKRAFALAASGWSTPY